MHRALISKLFFFPGFNPSLREAQCSMAECFVVTYSVQAPKDFKYLGYALERLAKIDGLPQAR